MDRSALSEIRTLVFGGSFDPVHLGHTAILNEVAGFFQDPLKILLIPTSISPFKEHRPAHPRERLQMLELALSETTFPEHMAVEILELEIWQKEPGRTIDTLKWLESQGHKVGLIIGADSLLQMETWKSGTEILHNVPLFVARRPDYQTESQINRFRKLYHSTIQPLDGPRLPCSSSTLRAELLSSFSRGPLTATDRARFRHCLSQKVLDFIEAHRLYAGET